MVLGESFQPAIESGLKMILQECLQVILQVVHMYRIIVFVMLNTSTIDPCSILQRLQLHGLIVLTSQII